MKFGRYVAMPNEYPPGLEERRQNAMQSFRNAGIETDQCYYKSGGLWWIYCTDDQLMVLMMGGATCIESRHILNSI
jgi:hypothetical protein